MAKSQKKPSPPTSFELLGHRVQRVLSLHPAQKARRAVIHRAHNESPEDWARLLDDIAETENVTVLRQEDGGARVSWGEPANI